MGIDGYGTGSEHIFDESFDEKEGKTINLHFAPTGGNLAVSDVLYVYSKENLNSIYTHAIDTKRSL